METIFCYFLWICITAVCFITVFFFISCFLSSYTQPHSSTPIPRIVKQWVLKKKINNIHETINQEIILHSFENPLRYTLFKIKTETLVQTVIIGYFVLLTRRCWNWRSQERSLGLWWNGAITSCHGDLYVRD